MPVRVRFAYPRGRVIPALPLFILLGATLMGGGAGAATRTDFRFLPAYFSGDYGTGIDTSIVNLPMILVVSSERQEFRVTVPYLSIRTSEPVLYLNGEVIAPAPGGSTAESGLGDVLVQDEIFFLQGTARRPWVSGILRIKLPTADEAKGLGSGEPDFGAGVAVIQPLGHAWNMIGSWMHIARGDPAGLDFRDTSWLTLGVHRSLSDRSSWHAFYDRRQSVIEGNPDLADCSLGYDRTLSRGVSLRSAAFVGLSDTAEDFGFSLGFSVAVGSR